MYGYSYPQNYYYTKLPKCKSIEDAAKEIEKMFGRSNRPYVQLVHNGRVVAEFVPSRHRWLRPLQAAGLEGYQV